MQVTKQYRRQRIKMRLRKKIKGTEAVPRLSIFRSNRDIYAQIINDTDGKTLVAVSSRDKDFVKKGTKTENSKELGKALATKALETGITAVVFDRNGYLYHGRVKALAESAREGGLKF
ncbi:MAG: 50S ribosomal protein L18 [Bacteroidales bacterium]|nr:50S ribosomal protein L18 [Bacteroidales bacterium]